MMDSLKRLAEEKSGGQIGLRQVWHQVFAELSSLQLEEGITYSIACACDSPAQVRTIVRFIRVEPADSWSKLQEFVDDSDTDLTGWISALESFQRWADKHNRQPEFPVVLGYLCCTEEVAREMPLNEAVEAMLEEYGFDG